MVTAATPDAKKTKLSTLRWGLVLLPVLLVAYQWIFDDVKANNLLIEVPKVSLLSWLETNWAYFYLHIFTFLPVFALSFDRNVHYYKKWKSLLPAILIMGGIFIAWDVFFTVQGVWGFNDDYLTGLSFLKLPVEEWLFFFTVPFACVFIYECLNFYIKKDFLARAEQPLTLALAVIFLAVGLLFWGHLYTTTTFLLAGSFQLFHYFFIDAGYRSRFWPI